MIRKFKDKEPKTDKAIFIAENAYVIGDVELGEDTSVWFGAVLRGDLCKIKLGRGSNIQDNCTLHGDTDFPVIIGEDVTVGHNAVVHGCEIGDGSLIGMGSVILNGAKIGKHCLVGAGAVVGENKEFPDNSLILGVPARVAKVLDEERVEKILQNSRRYIAEAKEYAE